MERQRPWPKNLDDFSEKIGKSSDLVQGPGGNTSWKDNDFMWMKASGMRLSNALNTEIFCKVSRSAPMVTLNTDGLRPSIESALHAVRPDTFVVHVHSVSAMSLGFRKKIPPGALEILNEFSIGTLDYFRPGIELSRATEEICESQWRLQGLLLKNHGLVIWGEDIKNLYEQLIEFEAQLGNLFPIQIEVLEEIRRQSLKQYLNNRYLTPDHAVFGNKFEDLSIHNKTNWISDLRFALEKALACIEINEEILFLSEFEVEALRNWEAEKLRQGMNT